MRQQEARGEVGWEGLPWARVGERCFLDEPTQLQASDLVGVEGGEGPSRTPGLLLLSRTHRLQALLKLLFTWYSISHDWVSRHTWLAIYGLDYAYKFNFPRQIDVPVDEILYQGCPGLDVTCFMKKKIYNIRNLFRYIFPLLISKSKSKW